ncbi:MAG: PAS domain-containing protein, partial [Psychrosphaera sp.]|nr:PAS domain-containing protein [Psychrosphaera sp.]
MVLAISALFGHQRLIRLRAINERNKQLSLALWGSGDQLWDWDKKRGTLQRRNILSHFSFADQESLSRPDELAQAIHPDDQRDFLSALRAHARGDKGHFEATYRLRDKTGEWRWLLDRGKITDIDEQGQIIRISGTLQDIHNYRMAREALRELNETLEQKVIVRTLDLENKHQALLETEKELAQKEHQRKLAQSETLASLGTLTAGIGHEIKNPVNFIGIGAYNLAGDLKTFEQWLISLAGDNAEDDVLDGFRQQLSPLFKHIDTITDGTDRIKTIVEDLRNFTQQDSAEKQTVNISQKLNATLNLVQPNFIETTVFTSDFDDNLQLKCYPAQLNQVFMNLLVNACDAISERRGEMQGQPSYGKPISEERGKVSVGCRQVKDTIEIFVSDNGNGMSDETQSRLFEPF